MSVKFVAPHGAIKRSKGVIAYWSNEIVNLERVETVRMFTRKDRSNPRDNTYSIVFFFGQTSSTQAELTASWEYPSEDARDADFDKVMSLGDLRTLPNDDFELD